MKLNSPQFNLMYKACMKASRVLIRDFGEIEKLQKFGKIWSKLSCNIKLYLE